VYEDQFQPLNLSAAVGTPWVLAIPTDDQVWPTLGPYGGTRAPIPYLDWLAARPAASTRGHEAVLVPEVPGEPGRV